MAETASVPPHLLTDTQLETLIAVATFCSKHGYSPTVRELRAALGLSSTGSTQRRLETLQRLGLITWQPLSPRTIRITGGADAIVAAHGIDP
jgi:repressor LexA